MMKLNIQLFADKTGTLTGSRVGNGSNAYIIARILWEQTANGSDANTSSVKVTLQAKRDDSISGATNAKNWAGQVKIVGPKATYTPISFSTMSSSTSVSTSWVTFKTATVTVAHADDGTCTPSISGYITGPSGTSFSGKTSTISATTVTFSTIPRASAITSVSSGTTDYAPSVVWTPASSDFKYKIKYSYGNWSYTTGLISPATTSAYTYNGYTITGATVAPYMTAASGTFTATLYTYDSTGTTQIGTASSATFTVTLNANIKPVATIGALSEAGGIVPSSWGIFIQNKSKLSFPISGTSAAGSAINNYTVTVNGETFSKTAASTITTASVLKTTGTNTISLTVKDGRGRTGTATKTFNVVAYSNPSVTTYSAEKVDADGNASETGQYVKYTIDGTIASCSNKNTKKLFLGYRTGSNITWVETSATTTPVVNTSQTIDPNTQTTIYFKVEDNLGGSDTKLVVLDSAFKLVNFNKTLTGMAIGKKSAAADNEELFEVNMPTVIEKGFYSKSAGNINARDGEESLIVKVATAAADSTPNNGIVLEYGPVEGYGGQLYIGDNANQGCYFGGWYNGERRAWQKIIMKNDLLNMIYPVGSIYMSVNNVNPGTFLGGTWTALQDRFLIGAGSSYGVNATGGNKDAIIPSHTHTGSVASSGAHYHTTLTMKGSGSTSGNVAESYGTYGSTRNIRIPFSGTDGAHTHTVTVDSTGSSATNANLPPYLAVYMWKRTA